jgi:hypothetical protein
MIEYFEHLYSLPKWHLFLLAVISFFGLIIINKFGVFFDLD